MHVALRYNMGTSKGDTDMFDQLEEHCDYEFNAQYDYIREAYAGTALDPYEEGYSDYLMDSERDGRDPLSFEAWVASLKAAPRSKWDDDAEIPF
jgi:hypothetical protein